jgi:transcription-repair coupling factor (superfamily II helicase)
MPKYDDLTITTGDRSYKQLKRWLSQHSYRHAETPILPGEFSVRGGDRFVILPAATSTKIQLDYFGDALEKLTIDDVASSTITLKDNRLLMEDGAASWDDWVVHPHYGIGKYQGRRVRANNEQEYVVLLYAGGDQLSVPVELEGELMPYLGSRTPRWSRLHSTAWQKTKKRIVENLVHVARDLLLTQASREVAPRPVYKPQLDWQQKLNETFVHRLTDDQERALKEISEDLTINDQPMDRLLSGDVGFGKTEVAIRAAATVLGNGRSVIVLAPTTVLVEQHYHVWQERFAGLPVKVRRLSRLQKLTSIDREAIAAGSYDILIGTHQLFSVAMPESAGLLIIDEEQRFGVKHKEHFKQLRSGLDVLSLSATPIPRTLYLGLSGLRDMSVIRTAPGGRQDVNTTVQVYNEAAIAQAVTNELDRQGQIYYVHNRVQTLPGVATRLERILKKDGWQLQLMQRRATLPAQPGVVRAAVVHGQSSADWLATVMDAFFSHELDILISTAIVENGLDNPRANTLVVERSELFGLSDLYQLRGRIGRRDEAGQALFLIGDREPQGKNDHQISNTTRERLTAIAEASTVGSGWELALKDLELRGAGSILGREQHGNLEAIGLVLYSRLLKRVVDILQQPSSSVQLDTAIVGLWRTKPRSLKDL